MNNKKWFKEEAKFGLMIHFGLYSLLAGEWQGQRMPCIAEWAQSYFRIPKQEYERLADIFNPIYLDTDEDNLIQARRRLLLLAEKASS